MTAPVYEARRTRATKAQMEHRFDVLEELVQETKPTSVRHLYYRAVVAGLVPKTQNGYGMVQRALVAMRRDGSIEYGAIVDNTRMAYRPRRYSSMREAAEEAARLYRRDLWTRSMVQVECWVESESVAGVVRQVCHEWCVDLYPCRGFSSISFAQAAAEEFNDDGRDIEVRYIGDHDPHGLEIEVSLRRELNTHLDSWIDVNWRRIGVTWEQVLDMDLPGGNPKKNYGYPLAVEAEALAAPTLRDLLTDAITDHLDPHEIEVLRVAEADERRGLRLLAQGVSE